MSCPRSSFISPYFLVVCNGNLFQLSWFSRELPHHAAILTVFRPEAIFLYLAQVNVVDVKYSLFITVEAQQCLRSLQQICNQEYSQHKGEAWGLIFSVCILFNGC